MDFQTTFLLKALKNRVKKIEGPFSPPLENRNFESWLKVPVFFILEPT